MVNTFLPRGWFLPVTPGSRFVTVGGALASDVHGKNHHHDGSFSEHVESLALRLPGGEERVCSPSENAELFRATCGGMGLTGIVSTVVLRLRPVRSSWIDQNTFVADGLAGMFELFERRDADTYSVGWIDCLAGGERLGRGLVMTGEHRDDGDLRPMREGGLSVPGFLPGFVLNRHSVRLFNETYHRLHGARAGARRVPLDTFFYPLDGVRHWNRIYGRNGFVQYQCVLPPEESFQGITRLLEAVRASGKGSFLAVLKLLGPANSNLLSFPMRGYTLALDFKVEPSVFTLLDSLDRIVLEHGGRLYLAKDARMSRDTFDAGYPEADRFRRLRTDLGLRDHLSSLQSERLGL